MRIVFVCKRLYTNRDLIDDRFGRLFHLPVQLAKLGHNVAVIALDYRRGRPFATHKINGVVFSSIPLSGPADSARAFVHVRRQIDESRAEVLIASGDIYIGALTAFFARGRP